MMKPDDRDIVCEQDYTPLSNAELVAHIERYAGLMHSTPLSDGEWLDDIIGPARALMARAEVADSLAYERLENLLFVEQRADDAEIERDEAIARAEEAEARVADLEAQLAAQQWRPAAEEPSEPGYYLVILRDWLWPCEIQRWEGPGLFGPNGWTIEIRDRVVAWQPLPDAPQEPPQ